MSGINDTINCTQPLARVATYALTVIHLHLTPMMKNPQLTQVINLISIGKYYLAYRQLSYTHV